MLINAIRAEPSSARRLAAGCGHQGHAYEHGLAAERPQGLRHRLRGAAYHAVGPRPRRRAAGGHVIVPRRPPRRRGRPHLDHFGLRATSPHDVIYRDVEVPYEHFRGVSGRAGPGGPQQLLRRRAGDIRALSRCGQGGQEFFLRFAHERIPTRSAGDRHHRAIQTIAGEIEPSSSSRGGPLRVARRRSTRATSRR